MRARPRDTGGANRRIGRHVPVRRAAQFRRCDRAAGRSRQGRLRQDGNADLARTRCRECRRAFRQTSSIWPAGLRLPAIIRSPPQWPARPSAKCRWPGSRRLPGQGVHGFVDGLEVRLGRPSFCGADELANEILCRDPEASVVAFRHGETRHVFAVRQRLRPDAPARLPHFRHAASGSRFSPAIANLRCGTPPRRSGFSEWRAGVTPADKIARIES